MNTNFKLKSRLGRNAQQHNAEEHNKIICVVNDYETFDKVVKHNENLANLEVIDFDNSKENIAITKRYNNFIDRSVSNCEEDFWCLFIHQDFGCEENISPRLEKFDKNCIWGAIGAKLYKGLFFGREGFKKSISINWGQIKQGNNDFNFKKYGRRIFGQKTVDAVDCCCIIIHSSLIKKYDLRFDENLSFHMYAEELCYRAKKEHKIKTKVSQIKCFHLGRGKIGEEFFKSAQYLKEKFKIDRIPSTCRN